MITIDWGKHATHSRRKWFHREGVGPVPNDPRHVMYVWVDALANYLTAVGYAQGPALPGGEGYAGRPSHRRARIRMERPLG